ncbi:MAG: hypothetical protein M3O78_07415, partial [Chloroflexota bacterium]|nr:hypothetical protein [Chloroflexota bacterium]
MTALDALQEAAERRWVAAWLEGPTWTRYDAVPVQLGDAAPDLELPETTGTMRHMSEYWTDGAAVLIFLRYFGCSCLA